MSAISGYLTSILNAVYGEQVRSAIVNAITQCYDDVTNPNLNTEAFSTAIEAAYADGFLDIQEKSTIAGMTNEKIIYRYTGNEAGYIHNGLYYYDGSAWQPIGSGIRFASTAAGMTDINAIYKYTGSETGYIPNSLYYYNGSNWMPLATYDTSNTIQNEIKDIEDFVGFGIGSYMGIYTQSTQTVDTRIKLINTPATIAATDARLLFKISAKKGGKIRINVSDYWIPDTILMEVTTCDSENFKISAIDRYTYIDANGNTQINTAGTQTGFFEASKGHAVFVDIKPNIDDCVVYIGIRYPQDKVTSNQYDKVVSSYIRRESDVKLKNVDFTKNIGDISCIHRGWADAPNNTLQAFYNAFIKGYKLCETDVRLTSDGVPVLAHEATVSGTVSGTSTTYTVANETLATLKNLVISNSNYNNLRIATLEEAVRLGIIMGGRYLLDIKDDNAYDECMNIIDQYDYFEGIIFNTNLSTAKADVLVEKTEKVNLLFAATSYSSVSNYEKYVDRPGKTFISIAVGSIPNTITEEQYRLISQAGFDIGLWAVQKSTFNTALSLYPSFIEYTDAAKSAYDWFALGEDYYNSVLDEMLIVR